MVCQTVKVGYDCVFMTKKGCGFNGGSCHTIIENCEGCNKVLEITAGRYCKIYPDPTAKWAVGGCPTASHIKKAVSEENQKINPLKASKRSKKQ
ncbi:MAG: PxxKW family cysteine-rich protein [Syntrophales bacterium]